MNGLDPFDVFSTYMAVKLHFDSESYCCVKYNYQTKVTQKSFFKRKDRYHFAKLGRKFEEKRDLVNFLVAQFTARDPNKWVGDMLGGEGDKIYREYQKRHESLSYFFDMDMKSMGEKVKRFDEIFEKEDPDSPYPLIIDAYMAHEVNLESVVILNRMVGFMKKADAEVLDPIVWPDLSRKIRKYSVFVPFDKAKCKDTVLSVFTS